MSELLGVLRRAQQLGFLGPGAVEEHLAHAASFRDAVPVPARALDLGSGAGIPGLFLALQWPASGWILLDSNRRRAAFLEQAVATLGLGHRVVVLAERAELAGHGPLRGTLDLVVARSFGAPAVTAECAAGLLKVGGRLVVSEPPEDDPARWPDQHLLLLGLRDEGRAGGVRVLQQVGALDDRFPRRVGVPAKRPLW